MKKWSRRIALAALIACLFIVTPSWAKTKDYDSCDPCGGWAPCSFGDLEVGGEFLWWKPCVDHLEYAHVEKYLGNNEYRTKSTIKTLCPDWGPGGRVWVYKPSLLCGTCGIGVSWTGIYLNHSEASAETLDEKKTSVEYAYLPSAAYYYGNYTNVTGHFKVGYCDYDVLLSYPCFCSECSIIRPFFGFAGLVLHQKFRTKGENEKKYDGDVKWKSDLCAYGLRVGTEYECKFADCFSVFGKLVATVINGCPDTKSSHHFSSHIEGEPNKYHRISEDECYRCYPGYHLAAGVAYDTCINNVDVIFRVGYELVEWHNLPHQRKFFLNEVPAANGNDSYVTTNNTDSSNRTFGWQGLLIGLGVYF